MEKKPRPRSTGTVRFDVSDRIEQASEPLTDPYTGSHSHGKPTAASFASTWTISSVLESGILPASHYFDLK